MTLIQIKNGKGRPVNPINLITDIPVCFDPDQERIEMWKQQRAYDDFEQSVTEHEAPGCEEGEAEGVLITQKREKDNPLQKEFRDCGSDESVRYPWCEYRQIWIVSTPEKVEVKATPYDLIMAERKRKAEKYGFDDKAIIERVEDYGDNECAWAAAAYCLTGQYSIDGVKMDEALFPWDLSYFKPTANDRIEELVKAGAFIIDEIIRLQALSNPAQ